MKAEVVKEIDRLIDTYTDGEIADVLNERGVRTVVTTPSTGGLRPPVPTGAIDAKQIGAKQWHA